MRRILPFLGCVALGTVLLIGYVCQHVSVVENSYTIRKKEIKAAQLVDTYKELSYQVHKLKSPTSIDERLKSLQLNLVQPRDIKLVHSVINVTPKMMQEQAPPRPSFMMLGSIEFTTEAYADSAEQ